MLNEEFELKENIILRFSRKWVDSTIENYEITVKVVINSGKAILVTDTDGTSYCDSKRGEALWIPIFALKKIKQGVYKLKDNVIDFTKLNSFIVRNKFKPISTVSIKECTIFKTFSEYVDEKSEKINSTVKKELNDDLYNKFSNKEYDSITFKELFDVLKKYDLTLHTDDIIDDIVSGDSGTTYIELVKTVNAKVVKNLLYISWEKNKDTNKYKLNVYIE